MISAVDTNILLDILAPNQQFYEASVKLQTGARIGEALTPKKFRKTI